MNGGGAEIVFVVGAGASLAEARARRRTWVKHHPPLDANFFRRVKKYRPGTLYNRVQAQAARLGVADLARSSPAVGLEDYLGRLYFNVHHNPRAVSVRAYFDLIDLYADEVVETTNWLVGTKGLFVRMLQRELLRGNRVTVLTFNIDLVIENALQQLAHSRPGAPWGLRDAYGSATPPRTAALPGDRFDLAGSGPTAIQLYKLHGSVNWVFQTRDYYPPADLVSKSREVVQLENTTIPTGRLRLRSGRRGRGVWYAFPLIVPPVYEKHGFIRMHLQETWDNAEAALARADQVVFWGYSFPAADTHARHFFQGLADQNPVLRRPTIINPDPDVAASLWPLLRAERITQYRDAETYLAT